MRRDGMDGWMLEDKVRTERLAEGIQRGMDRAKGSSRRRNSSFETVRRRCRVWREGYEMRAGLREGVDAGRAERRQEGEVDVSIPLSPNSRKKESQIFHLQIVLHIAYIVIGILKTRKELQL